MDLIFSYHQSCLENGYDIDSLQEDVLRIFQEFGESLLSFWKRPFTSKGIYIYGPVGRGKTFLMDLFYNQIPLEKKMREHFSPFMREVHTKGLDQFIKEFDQKLLCLDEFQVGDIGDAMILKRLFESLIQKGVHIVATSNLAPRELYRDGLHYDRFEPFVHFLEENFRILPLLGKEDYRLQRMSVTNPYFNKSEKLENLWQSLKGNESEKPLELWVDGRRLYCERSCKVSSHGCLGFFDFLKTFEKPVGVGDFQAMVKIFSVIFLDNIPKFHDEEKDLMWRFVRFIDILYESRTLLALSSKSDLKHLFPPHLRTIPWERTYSRLMDLKKRWED